MKENLDVFGFELTDDVLQQIAPLEIGESQFEQADPEAVRGLSSRRLERTIPGPLRRRRLLTGVGAAAALSAAQWAELTVRSRLLG